MALEGVEVAQARWSQDRRPEAQVGGVEDGWIVVLAGLEAVEQLSQRLDPEAEGEVGVERRDRLAEERRVVLEARVGVDCAAPGDLEVEPARRLGPELQRRRQAPGCAGRGACVARTWAIRMARESMAGMTRRARSDGGCDDAADGPSAASST